VSLIRELFSYQDNTNANEQDLPRDQPSAPLAFRQLTLIHRHRARIDTRAQARNDTTNDQVREGVGGRLQSCADDDEAHCKPDHVPPTKQVSDGEVENTSEESA
jgi:hypothetical protein